MVDALTVVLESGSANPTPVLEFYDASNTLLGSVNFSADAFGAAANGTATAAAISDGTAVAAGTISYVVFKNRDAAEVCRNTSVGLSGSGSEVIVSTLSVEIGSTISVSSATITMPES